jgi:biotin carboxyl carrier protein
MNLAAQVEAAIDPPVGEILSVPERMIVAPAMGTFCLLDGLEHKKAGEPIVRGDLIGAVQSLRTVTPVRSRFDGVLVEFLAVEGERVRRGQVVAWLRAT